MSVFKILNTVMGSLFKKPATLMYPVVPREWQERTRGHIDIDVDNCILCGMCQRKCPTNAITVDRNGHSWTIERMKCIQCGCCTDNCPKKCLSMAQTYTTPSPTKITDVFEIPVKEKKAAGGASGDTKLQCNTDECVFCGMCAKNCPQEAITVDRESKTWKVDEDACVKCGLCTEKCPKKCLEIK